MYNNGNGKPLSIRKRVNVLVGLTILAWATQTLLSQWARGADTLGNGPVEKFTPDSAIRVGTTIELRTEATVIGAEVKLRNICRWSDQDAAVMQSIGDLTLARLDDKTPFVSITIPEIKLILKEAGANLAMLNFVGSTTCGVNRSDAQVEQGQSLQKWIEAKEANPSPALMTTPKASANLEVTQPVVDVRAQSLRDMLKDDLATRLNLSPADLQVAFKTQDEQTLNLSSALFEFQIEPYRAKALGSVAWQVTVTNGDQSRRVHVSANARAWQTQTVLTKPLNFQQMITAEDIDERRTLVEVIGADPLVSKSQSIGQQAARELKPGMIMTAKMLDPAQLVKTGQLVLVDAKAGGVLITSTARALENGTLGRAIKVKNETTKETLMITITGPQRGELNGGGNLTALTTRD